MPFTPRSTTLSSLGISSLGRRSKASSSLGRRSKASSTPTNRSRTTELATFQIADPELLRATSANCPLRSFGAALRENAQLLPPPSEVVAESHDDSHSASFHPWSRPVSTIQEFWSHSWRDKAWKKVVLLLLHYNGFPAAAVGTLAAFVGSALFVAGVLPVMVEMHDSGGSGFWGLLLGWLFFIPTLLCWRSDSRVFLDKICISQWNEKKKLDGVLGIGAFLHASDTLLVLFDTTYVTRLWCVFELAGFSKLMLNDSNKSVRFLPLSHAPVFLYLLVIITVEDVVCSITEWVLSWPVIVTSLVLLPMFDELRSLQDSNAQLKAQLEEFSFDAADCYCCSVSHVQQDTGARLACDRKSVRSCIIDWFGSVETFNDFVNHSLFENFSRGMCRVGLPVRLIIMMFLPIVWTWVDRISAHLRHRSWEGALRAFLGLVFEVFLLRPCWLTCCCALAYGLRRRLSSRFLDMLLSVGLGIASTGIWLALGNIMHHAKDANMEIFAGVVSAGGIVQCLVYGCCGQCYFSGADPSSSPVSSSSSSSSSVSVVKESAVSVEEHTCASCQADLSVLGRGSVDLPEAVETETTISI
eukprot:TRINITY_DN6388_c2_g1_i1.p1 TRINITY_DN6388_c2_g1~~TRINITY_DN6388_c2_g1_i1.p1  ORF type:complete len:624 (+),score=47.53 TRINITY_DN6388_c2_g1_i1:121-1872(+)